PDALITAAHSEMHVHAINGHAPGQPLIPVDELVVPRCRRDDAVTVASKWMAACGREGNPEPLADVVEPVDHLHQIAPDLMNVGTLDRKSTRLNSSHVKISYAVFCLKTK